MKAKEQKMMNLSNSSKSEAEFAPVNLSQASNKNKINVTLMGPPAKGIQRKTFEKVDDFKVPNWWDG